MKVCFPPTGSGASEDALILLQMGLRVPVNE